MPKHYTKELNLYAFGIDSFGRKVYQDTKTAELFKDTSLRNRVSNIEDLCSVTKNKIEGEPDTPIPFMSWGKSYFIEIHYKDRSSNIFYKKLENKKEAK